MIQFKSWRQYTHFVNGVRYPINIKEPFLLIYLPENTNFIEEYGKMNIKPIDYRIVSVPMTTIPRTRMTPDLIKLYRSIGLIPYSLTQKVPTGKNVILDLSNFTTALDNVLNPTNYRQRAGFILKNVLLQSASHFPNNYQKVLMYSVNLNNDVKQFVDRKIFPLLKDMKAGGEFPFDHLILNVMSDNQPGYRLLVKDKTYNFQRVINYLKRMKGIPTEEEADEELEKATNIVVKSVSSIIEPSNKGKITGAVQTFLKKQPDSVAKILAGDITADEVKDITTASILYKSSGDFERSKSLAKNVSAGKKTTALKAIDKTIAKDLIQPEKAVSLSIDPTISSYSPEKMVDEKSPNHVYKKRQLDFEINLKNDLVNSFKVLESKDIPLKLESITFSPKTGRPGEIERSDINIAKIKLSDKYGNTHSISMELPKINPNTGVFRLNGRQKCLVNQIVQNPITFPKPGASRFESSYSVFRIYVKVLRNVKYLESFMSYKMPLFYLLAFSFGFEETCKQYNIGYEITDKRPNKTEKYFAKIKNGQYVIFKNVNNDVQKQLCMGLMHDVPDHYDIDGEFPSKDYFERLIIKMTGRMNSTFLISSNLQNIVDPVCKQILMQKQLPTDLNFIMQYMAEKVVSGFHIERNDLSNQRIRNSEVLVHLAQKQILAAYTVYKEQVLSGNTQANFEIPTTKVLSDFLNTELVVDMEYANPIEEMSTMTRVSPVGKKVGGIPDKRAIHTSARNLHPTYFGNLDPLDTPEGGNIGIVQQLTVDALISSSRGLFSAKNITNTEKSGMLSTTTCMVPFLENTDGARVIMLSNQAKQMLPLKNPQPPVVQSGYESILTGVLSDNFIKRAPCNGKVVGVTGDAIKIKCSGGKDHVVDISPVHLRSGSGKDTLSVFKTLVNPPQSVREGEVIADGACMSQGSISLGRPLLTALMPYKGYNFEDGAVISESVANQDKLTSLHGIIEEVLISENDRLLYIAKIEEDIQKGQPLLRKTIGDIEDLIGFDDDETTDLLSGQYIKKSPGGRIVDIEVFSNVGDDKFPELKSLIQRTNKKHEKPSNDKFTIKGETIKGIFIRFKLEQELRVDLGDKLCNRYGNKGIISLVEKDELMPRLPNGERLEVLFNPIGLIARMNIGQLYEMYCGLMARELGRRIPTINNKTKVINLIQSVYSQLDTSKNKKTTATLVANLNRLSTSSFANLINQVKTSGFYPIIIPPFMAPKHTDVAKGLKVLGLQPSYNLFLPEFGIKTVKPIPVGYMYVCKLEHMADAKIYARGTGPTTGKTSQPTSGKRRDGGQRLGELDTYSFISYNCPATLAEFMGPLSDDYATKEEIISEIIQSGGAGYREPKISPARDLLNSYFTSLMLVKD
jgi:DNA-directed RNA polymerase beta subunit